MKLPDDEGNVRAEEAAILNSPGMNPVLCPVIRARSVTGEGAGRVPGSKSAPSLRRSGLAEQAGSRLTGYYPCPSAPVPTARFPDLATVVHRAWTLHPS